MKQISPPDHDTEAMHRKSSLRRWFDPQRSIHARLALGFVAISVFACAALAGWSALQMNERYHSDAETTLSAGELALAHALSDEQQRQLSIARFIAAMPEVQAAVADEDRHKVLTTLREPFDALARGADVTDISVTSPSGTVFARVNQPDAFGEDVSRRRPDILAAMREDREAVGLEQMPNGVGVVGVVPLRQHGRVVGALNVGTVLNAREVDRIRSATGLELAVHILRADGGTSTLGATRAYRRLMTSEDLRGVLNGQNISRESRIEGRPLLMRLIPLRGSTGQVIAMAEIQLDHSAAEAQARRDLAGILGIGTVVLAVALLLAGFLGRSIARPVMRMTQAMTALAGGDLSVEIPARERRDEMGAMAKAMQVFHENALAMRRLDEERAAAERAAELDKKASLQGFAHAFEESVGGIVGEVSVAAVRLNEAAQSLSATAEQSAGRTRIASIATEEVSSNMGTIAAASEELAASVSEISRQVTSSSEIASRAVDQATATDALVLGLSEAAGEIGSVVRLISDIANRTNLLALNATIEAARAGESGKGFAVVAAEVKTLATQTAKATDDIGSKVAEMQAATAEAVAAIRSIGETITEMSTISSVIAAAVGEQGTATREIACNVQRVAQGTQEVADNISSVSGASEQTGEAAESMLASAARLAEQGTLLDREVTTFLTRIRTAS